MNELQKEIPIGNRVHFIGIGGISMSGLSRILAHMGYIVSGSDLNQTPLTDDLKSRGIQIFIGHSASNIGDADWVVYTIAVKGDNPEIMAAKQKGIPVIERATLLGYIMGIYPYPIGVSGSHGKTTTTSMLSIMLQKAHLDPTVLVGGMVDDIGGNVRVGNSHYILTEACEYNESFLKSEPYMALILNIDEDHLDYFKGIDDIYRAFLSYANLVHPQGIIIGCNDDPLVLKLLKETHQRKITFAIENSGDWIAQNIKFNSDGFPSYRGVYKGQDMGRFELKMPGLYNVYNALAASAAAWALGISITTIKESLESFKGAHRRFEIKGNQNRVTVIDDYAHHPTEVRATLQAARKYPHNKLWCVFQPHTYTRTEKLFYEFSESFLDADEILITDIYGAREKAILGVSSENLAKAIQDRGKSARYMSSFDKTVNFLSENVKPGDLVLTMGAGDIFKVGDQFLKGSRRAN